MMVVYVGGTVGSINDVRMKRVRSTDARSRLFRFTILICDRRRATYRMIGQLSPVTAVKKSFGFGDLRRRYAQ